MIYNHIT